MTNSWGPIAHLPAVEQKRQQEKKLARFVQQYLYPFSPWYRALFDQHRIDPRCVRSFADLARLPLTAKPDFLEESDRFRRFILRPDQNSIRSHWPLPLKAGLAARRLVRGEGAVKDLLAREFRPLFMTFTTGTTDMPVPFVYTSRDLDNLRIAGARMVELFGIPEGEHLVNLFPYAPHLAFWQVVFGGFGAGVLILSTGGGKVLGTERTILSLLKMRPAVIIGVPGYVYHVLRQAREQGERLDFDKMIVLGANAVSRDYKLKVSGMMSEMGADNVKVLGTYGFTEARLAWGECPAPAGESSGYHLYPDLGIFEVINPRTGEVLDEGESGELVYTSLDARGSAVLRYRTGDYVEGGITYAPCPHCGRTVPRVSSRISRLSDRKEVSVTKVKGTLVNFDNFRRVLSGFDGIEEWQVELSKKNDDPHEVDTLALYCALRPGEDEERLRERINRDLAQKIEVSANEIHFLPLNDLVKRLELESANKARRIIDRRP